MIVAGAIVVIVTGILFWRLSGPPATVIVATIDFHGSPQMVALASTVGCWQEYELFHGSFTENAISKTFEQRSGPGLQLSLALGLVLLMVGSVASRRRGAGQPSLWVQRENRTTRRRRRQQLRVLQARGVHRPYRNSKSRAGADRG